MLFHQLPFLSPFLTKVQFFQNLLIEDFFCTSRNCEWFGGYFYNINLWTNLKLKITFIKIKKQFLAKYSNYKLFYSSLNHYRGKAISAKQKKMSLENNPFSRSSSFSQKHLSVFSPTRPKVSQLQNKKIVNQRFLTK